MSKGLLKILAFLKIFNNSLSSSYSGALQLFDGSSFCFNNSLYIFHIFIENHFYLRE